MLAGSRRGDHSVHLLYSRLFRVSSVQTVQHSISIQCYYIILKRLRAPTALNSANEYSRQRRRIQIVAIVSLSRNLTFSRAPYCCVNYIYRSRRISDGHFARGLRTRRDVISNRLRKRTGVCVSRGRTTHLPE